VNIWPDTEEKLLRCYVAELHLEDALSRRPYESVLRRFQRCVMAQAPRRPVSRDTVETWLREQIRSSSLKMTW